MDTNPKYTRRTIRRVTATERSVEALIEEGKAAFVHGDYTTALRAWNQALYIPSYEDVQSSRLRSALAEAFFRRALSVPDTSIDDLHEAIRLVPEEPRYQYHLALAHHRRDLWQSAIPLYRALLERTPPYTRAAFPLAIALLETDAQPQADTVWQLLSPEEQMCLRAASALLTKRGKKDLDHLLSQAMHPFWTGLAAFRLKKSQAEAHLSTALQDSTLPRPVAGIARHYLGVLAWEGGRQAEALEHWQAAVEAGIRTPWLSSNLAWAYAQSALAQLTTEDSATLSAVLDLAERGLRYAPGHPVLCQIANHARQQLGYRAARQGDWETARKYFWAAYEAGQRDHTLLTNLALTAEALGQHAQAGSLWKQLMRSRPRKATADGFMSDEQVVRGWQRAAQCFIRAGSYKDAARAYQNALRYAPQDATLQLERIAALFQDGQYVAAYSAVTNLLIQYPEHKEALTWKAYLSEQIDNPYVALEAWQRVLALDPEHPTARQHIAQVSCKLGDRYLEFNDLRRAFTIYRGGLEVAPQDARLRAAVIRLYGLLGDLGKAREDSERLLQERPDDLEVYYWLMQTWVSLDKDEIVHEYLRRLEALQPPPPVSFYTTFGVECVKNEYGQWAKRFAEIARQYPSINAQELLTLARIFLAVEESQQATECLEQAIALSPEMAEAHLWLGLHLLSRAETRAKTKEHLLQRAKEHLLQAERLARQQRNPVVMAQARRALSTLS
ncbi:MAG: hypothetical protein DDG58_01715 [Ardenticatenia bacterium]|nr:MAG: hypothetical protein DDG58_01715 [Ardenticatenia bacterium]